MAKLLTDQDCECDCMGLPIVPSPNPVDQIVVRSQPGIDVGNFIEKFNENGKTVYELQDFTLVLPQITFSNDQNSAKEVGQTVATVHHSGNIVAGSFPLVTKSISPDPGGLNLNAPFTFAVSNVKRTTPGKGSLYTVTAIDDQGNPRSVESYVPFKHAFYTGFNSLNGLNQAQIKALATKQLLDSIIDSVGGAHSYVVPGSPAGDKYIYFSGPVGTPVPVGAVLNGLPVPLYFALANVSVTNIFDGALIIPYWVVRTANKFAPGTYLISVS